jgi:glycosyltransferase involved in cell wall biosynthesis
MKIEIIIPAYNCTKTLNRTLASLEAQTYDDFYVHVIDDCSTEDIVSIINQHKSNLNIKVTRNEKNLGCGMTRQVGIDSTDADYIAFLDSDDVLMPYTVETWASMAISNPEYDIFHSYFYEQENINSNPALILHKDGFTWCHGKLYKTEFIRKWNIKNLPEVKYSDDSFFNSMCTELGSMGIIPMPLYIWINNSDSITRAKNSSYKIEKYFDFIHAMRLSIEFVYKNGVTSISHLPQTMSAINSYMDKFDDRCIDEYNMLLELINGGVQ